MYEQIRSNRRASWLLMAVVVGILCLLGYVIGFAWTGANEGGLGLLGLFGVIAVVWSVISYYAGASMVLAVSGAHQVTHDQEPRLYNIVEEMSIAAGLAQPPAVYVVEDQALNAFATGRDPAHSSVTVTRGLLQTLDRDQLQGVVAHELSHIRNYDIRFATLVGILVGMIALVADLFLRSRWFGWGGGRRGSGSGGNAGAVMMVVALGLAILAPLAAYVVQFAISRRREYLADASGVELTRNPLGLARALNTIGADQRKLHAANRATAHLYIANPLRKTKEVTTLFDTHPPLAKRIGVLLDMAHAGPEALTPAGGSVEAGQTAERRDEATASRGQDVPPSADTSGEESG